MKFSNELLKKYGKRQFTAQEREALDSWLNSTEVSAEETYFPAYENKQEVEAALLSGIRSKIAARENKWYRTTQWVPYLSAACLVLLLWGIQFLPAYQSDAKLTEAVLDNGQGKVSKDFRTESGLIFRLSARSTAQASTDVLKSTSNVSFTGAMEVTNTTDKEIRIVFTSTGKEVSTRAILCKPGKSYVALQDPMEENEIIIISRSLMNELPGSVVI
jgi:hypothetical protein